MSEQLQLKYQQGVSEDEAGQRGLETLLNCYCREVATPEEQVTMGSLFGQGDWPLALRAAMKSGEVMHILMPRINTRLLMVVTQDSLTGNYRYHSPGYFKTTGQRWQRLEWHTLATQLLKDLSLKYDQPFNHELLQQVRESVGVTRTFLGELESLPPTEPLQAFLHSEQSLLFGHPFHPAPKSRQGFSHQDVMRYSPEMRVGFALHYFSVKREFLLQQSVLDESCDAVVAANAPVSLQASLMEDFALIPVHPWQAEHLLKQPLVLDALKRGHLNDLGIQGDPYYPTSSIRTLFNPHNDYFYKCSLHVRITNCVRKNAIYELDGALMVTRVMRELQPQLVANFPGLRVMEEPAYQSVNLGAEDTEQNRLVTEGFGMILRKGVQGVMEERVTPVLAGALFGNRALGETWMETFLQQAETRNSLSQQTLLEQWFTAYVEQLMPPVLYCFFQHGVIFEPHLQNVLIGIAEGLPVRLYLRDFEGVKLQPEHFPEERLSGVSEKVRKSLWYNEEKGWKRIVYCLFVNNFCEAIAQLAAGNSNAEARLWRIVHEQLHAYQLQYGNDASSHRINELLAGEAFPAKANLINRFFKRADREVSYVPLHNPLNHCAGSVS